MNEYNKNHPNDTTINNIIDSYKTLFFVIQDNFVNSIDIIEPFKKWIKSFYYLRKKKE